jgi:hypothetical protein
MVRSGMRNAVAKAWAWLRLLPPDVLEMTESVAAVETGSGPVVPAGGENGDRPVVASRENASTSAVSSGSRGDNDAVRFEDPGDVREAAGQERHRRR